LLENHTLTLQQAFEQARTLELAQKHSASVQSNNSSFDASATASDQSTSAAIKSTAGGGDKQKCYFCGNHRHPRAKCPAKDSCCNKCSKIGHWERVCRSNKSTLGALSMQNDLSNQPTLCATKNNDTDHSIITTYINNKAVKTLIDTGSELSFISKKIADKLNLYIIPIKKNVTLADPT